MRGISGNLAEWVSRERRSAPPPAVASPFDGGPTSDVDFLAAFGVSDALLAVAAARAAHFGTRARAELLATGFPRERYWGLLAEALGVEYVDDLAAAVPVANTGLLATDAVRDATALPVTIDGREILLVAPDRQKLAGLSERLAAMPALRARVRIAAPETIRAFIVRHHHRSLAHYAVNRLARVMPALSSGPSSQRGASGAVALLAAPLAMTLTAPSAALFAIELFATLFFLNCSVWKLATAFGRARRRRMEPLFDDQLPTYTVLVPLYREADVAEDLVQHLGALDYPTTKLQIILLLEADDFETRRAIVRHADRPPFEILTVPPGEPRTKPRALTYALPLARGDLVVVFDAEDRPERDQLRKAAAAFREWPELGCVQARLLPDNAGSWLTRMFTMEYAANFEVTLPRLTEWRVPLPLGGTSNHFPRRVLEKVGAWDPYNVTEDADLGIRLARFGFQSATIWSRTYEEAPVTFRQWLPQRRRWIKGWMQTVSLCFRRTIAPGLTLSLRERLAVHGVLTAGVVGLLLYPISLAVVALAVLSALEGRWPESPSAWFLLGLNLSNLAAVLVAAIVSSVRGLAAARALRLTVYLPLLPLYWALMSLAAWQALFQFLRRPSFWEKTTHGVARDRRTPEGSPFAP